MQIFLKPKKILFNNINSEKSLERVKRIWIDYIRPEWKLLIISIIFMSIYSIANVWSVSLLKPVFDKVFISKNKNILTTIAWQIMLAFGLKGFAQYVQSIATMKLGTKLIKELQCNLYDKIIAQDLEFYHTNNSNSLLVYFMYDLKAIRNILIIGITTLIRDSSSVLFLIILMFLKNFNMALVMFIFFPIGFYPVVYFGKKIKKIFYNQQNYFEDFYAILSQSFQGIKIIKSYNMETIESKRIRSMASTIANIEIKMAKNNNILGPLMEFFGGLAASGTLFYGGYKIMQGYLSTGDFVVFLIAIVTAYQPMKSLASLNSNIQIGLAAINRIFSIIDKKPKVLNRYNAKIFKTTKGIIKISHVKFSYISNIEVLHNINLEINEGEKVVFVGPAGSGKSTLINLILRFYDVKEGKIEIDGEDIRNITMKSLRENIALVSQDIILFDDTIKKNILMGNPNATYDDAIKAAKNASAHNFILNQIKGYDTVVGERGSNLSGGQKQMISIARAMLKNSKILLLDEATSSLDSKSEKMVQESLNALMIGKTSIFITHRLSNVINSDRIYVFETGNIVESGTHKELLELNGYYANLCKLQYLQ
ncbi:MAG: ABC transporter ATP-binding protein/permease [Endomicrobium sp.]|jgi:subfamily B ATP-binding cassette protein MsbA|nr:ABC transporter ATP-binding protein/permease [Endomicrobium sp.]